MIKKKLLFLATLSYLIFLTTNVMAQPTITLQPQDQTVLEGTSATFSVTATSLDPITYQWYKGGVIIDGATNSEYTTPATVLADNEAVFYCNVSDLTNSVESANVSLYIVAGEAPAITEQPENQFALEGSTATFSITATGTAPLQYQWQKNEVNVAGATSANHTTPGSIAADNESTYRCIVSNSFGVDTSGTVTLYVAQSGVRIDAGLQLLYEFDESSGETIGDKSGVGEAEDITITTPENVVWTPNGLETFMNAETTTPAKGSKITAACNSTDEITLEVWIMPEFVAGQNSRRIFTNSLSGDFRNFSIIQNGDQYEVRLRTTGTSFNGEPGVHTSPNSVKAELTHLVYTRNIAGTANIYINGELDTSTTVSGAMDFSENAWIAIGSEPLGGLTWRGTFYLASVYNRALSDVEVLHNFNVGDDFDTTPYFTISPKDKHILEGESIFLDSYAVSVLPISYQWRKNGTNIPGATERQLNIANLGSLDNGTSYECRAMTSAGPATSSAATVYVTSLESRVNNGIQAFYQFTNGSGNLVNDVSGVGQALNLNIFSTEAVAWENHGLRINSAPSIVTTTSATKITSPLKSSNELTIEAWVSSASTTQASPSRIFTISSDGSNRNLSLGQNNDSYEVNIRTTGTDNNGTPAIGSSAGTVSVSGFDHVVFTRSADGIAKFYINGTERVSTTLAGDFSNWNDAYLLSLGNEFGVDQHWKGLVNLVAVFDRALSNSEVLRNYNFGAYGVVAKPSNVTLEGNEIGNISISWTDNSTNEEGFKVERGEGNPLVYSVIGNVGQDSTEFTDGTVIDNKNYSYRVKAFYALGESDYSDSLSVTSLISPVAAPTGLEYTTLESGHPQLSWNDNSDNELGFKIERKTAEVGTEFALIDSVLANETTYGDLLVNDSTTYVYRVYAFSADTVSEMSGEKLVYVITGVDDLNKIPTEFSLAQNYPNPFNPTTTVKFGLPQNSNVTIVLYNLLGQKVMQLANRDYSAGNHSIIVNASNLTSGIYIYSINATGTNGNNFKTTKKMILLK